jgi:hypothetical protein
MLQVHIRYVPFQYESADVYRMIIVFLLLQVHGTLFILTDESRHSY